MVSKTFSDLKSEISIIQVAEHFGYVPDLRKGKKYIEMKNNDGDTIIVKNPNEKETQHYWNRHDSQDKGDLISFLKYRANLLNAGATTNDYEKINAFLSEFTGSEIQNSFQSTFAKIKTSQFKLSDYQHEVAKLSQLSYLTDERGISKGVLQSFKDHIYTVKKIDSKYDFTNIGFPLYSLEDGSISGFDLRNWNFKSISEGTLKSKCIWFKVLPPLNSMVQHVFIGESPIDVLSFYQMNYRQISPNSAFISLGGGFSQDTVKLILDRFPNAVFHTVFDNDLMGSIYDVLVEGTLNNRSIKYTKHKEELELISDVNSKLFPLSTFSIEKSRTLTKPTIRIVCHKSKGYSDFNDALRKLNFSPLKL